MTDIYGYVCPACAGMIRPLPQREIGPVRLPRMRGDDPVEQDGMALTPLFAPHARG